MIGIEHYIVVSAIIFVLGVLGIFLNRKNVIVILLSLELILLAVNINLVRVQRFPGRFDRASFRNVRIDRRLGRGCHRSCDSRHLFPRPRHYRG